MTITDDAEQNVSKFCFIQPTVRIIFFSSYIYSYFSVQPQNFFSQDTNSRSGEVTQTLQELKLQNLEKFLKDSNFAKFHQTKSTNNNLVA